MGRAITLVTCAAITAAAHADFEVVNQYSLLTSNRQAFGIGSDGTNWFVATISTARWDVMDQDLNFVSTTSASAGSQFRGLSYSMGRGTVFAVDYPTGNVHEFNLDGSLVGSFMGPAAKQVNAIGVNRLDDTVWMATFAGGIFHYDPEGTLLDSFNVPVLVTGLAVDEAAGTLLLMESTNDFIHEYTFDGSDVGTPIASDSVPGNGLGLSYDATTATLYATTQSAPARLTVFQDPDRMVLGEEGCFADFDENGMIDKLDFISFMRAWQGKNTESDCNGDGMHDVLDLLTYMRAYQQGECSEMAVVTQEWSHGLRVLRRSHKD